MRSATRASRTAPIALVAVAAASAVCTVAIAGGSSSPSHETAVRFLERVVGEIARNDYGRAWLSLYPAQQRAISRREYVACEQLSPIPGRLASLSVIRFRHETVRVAGGPAAPVSSTAVTFRIGLRDKSTPASVVVVHTVHALRAGGHWTWILPRARYRLHRSGTCTRAAAPAGR